jgi:hypothetical protein
MQLGLELGIWLKPLLLKATVMSRRTLMLKWEAMAPHKTKPTTIEGTVEEMGVALVLVLVLSCPSVEHAGIDARTSRCSS